MQNLLTVIGQYHLSQDPSFLLSSSFLLFFFVHLFVLLFNFPKLESLWLQRKKMCPRGGMGAGRGQQIPIDLAFWGGCFCRVWVSSQGPMVVSQSGHYGHWEGDTGRLSVLSLQSKSTWPWEPRVPKSIPHSLPCPCPSHAGMALPVPSPRTWGEDDGHLGCTTLTPHITSAPRMGHQVTSLSCPLP